jgi:DNA-binding transcriptional ArsR family regulator
MSDVNRIFEALGDANRRGIVELLRKRSRRAGDIAQALGISAAAASRHLRILRMATIIEERAGVDADARSRVYALRPKPFAPLKKWIEDIEAFWGEQLAYFKEHAEAVHAGGAVGGGKSKPKGRRRRDDVR